MILLTDFPSIVKKYAPYFEDCFSPEGYQHFKKAISGFIISENKTLEGINRLFLFDTRNQSSFNKFFNRQNFDLAQINQTRLDLLQQIKGTKFKTVKRTGGVLSVDNTLLKHYGKHIDGIYNLKDYVNDCYRLAHDLVTLHYSDDQTDYPIYYRLWDAPDWEAVAKFLKERGLHINEDKWEKRTTAKKKWNRYMRQRYKDCWKKCPDVKQIYKSKLHIAEDLIREFCKQYPSIDFPIALDGGFTSAHLCHIIATELKRNYVGSLSGEQCIFLKKQEKLKLKDFLARLVAQHKADPKNPVFKKVSFNYKGEPQIAYAYFASHRIKGFTKKQRLVISFSKKDLSDNAIFTITNRLNWYPSGILRIRRHRWPVETYHQEGKAEGLEKYQLRNYKAIQTYICFIVVTYSMLKCTVHDDELLSSIQQRLLTETDGTLPFLRRLMKAEGLLLLIEYITTKLQQGYSLNDTVEPLMQSIAYS